MVETGRREERVGKPRVITANNFVRLPLAFLSSLDLWQHANATVTK